ncbi:MAG: 6-phosphogluconolactonase, partial [Niabella sp.]|nr:6-phosphogluconolactonase [Niabella sp.]
VGLAPEVSGSCRNDFQQRLIAPLGLRASQYHFFDALAKDLENECTKMENEIARRGGIDLMVVGIGMNGHIGFNEPGTASGLHAHVINLDATTKTVGQKYFKDAVSLNKGITLGLADLMEAKKVILVASGSHKAGVIKQAIEGPITENFPATILQQHPNAWIMIDAPAAADLKQTGVV